MAKRQARFTAQDLADDPRLQDDSPQLWSGGLGEVPRRLLTSAVRCFASNGFHATTTRDISEGVGLSPAALYVHFPSKELVLFEIIRTGHERVLAYIQEPGVLAVEPSAERLRAIVARYTAWHARYHVAARVSQYELAGLTAEHYAEVLELRHQTNEFFRDAVARGVTDGSFAQVDVKRVTRAMLSLSIDLVRWYRLEGSDSPEQLGDFYADLALKLVAPGGPNPPRTQTVPALDGADGGRG
ncbi:TetR family transcriptional regulator [Micromonospora sp. Llam0]|uniref:TetR/AcrR family transcriptional regulator n=1 Tax=Micromonospora sp. Llam0 TaxID=2485143 RepID=UPI000F48D156|nr:TetR/AcrR family transcriptional regulator [Micromonospora sp. Llam0]ROO59072.1 TetR family transcriptional regulator [Micromonospora sp. Llam0]